jgi:hypothetical protein
MILSQSGSQLLVNGSPNTRSRSNKQTRNRTTARQRFGNRHSRGNEHTWKSIASQRLAKHMPVVTDKTDNTRDGDGDLYSVRLEFSSVQS